MKTQKPYSIKPLLVFSFFILFVFTPVFLYLLFYQPHGPYPEAPNSLKEIAEFFGGMGQFALILIYGRSLLKIAISKGPLLNRFIPDVTVDSTLSFAKKILKLLNQTHKYIGAAALVIVTAHAVMMGASHWNFFLEMVLVLLAWQGIFGLFLVLRFSPASLKRYGYLVHAQLFTGIMIGIFAGFGHLLT